MLATWAWKRDPFSAQPRQPTRHSLDLEPSLPPAGERFWQPKSYVFHVFSQRKLLEKFDYIHVNPVKARLVERAEEWRWSSARWHLRHQTVGVPIAWIE